MKKTLCLSSCFSGRKARILDGEIMNKTWKSTFSCSLIVLGLAAACFSLPAQGSETQAIIGVKVNRAKVMKIPRPASMIIIGNNAIADATIKDSQTLIITGKQYGTTNLIVLDSAGEPIADEVVRVSSAPDGSVVVYKGAQRSTYSCDPHCERVMRIGDNEQEQTELAKQIETHIKMSRGEDVDLGDSE